MLPMNRTWLRTPPIGPFFREIIIGAIPTRSGPAYARITNSSWEARNAFHQQIFHANVWNTLWPGERFRRAVHAASRSGTSSHLWIRVVRTRGVSFVNAGPSLSCLSATVLRSGQKAPRGFNKACVEYFMLRRLISPRDHCDPLKVLAAYRSRFSSPGGSHGPNGSCDRRDR